MILRALSVLWTSVASPMGDHLWQSTLFVALAAILVFTLRKNHARVRYWIWLTASVKFLIPFSLLITFGSHLARPRATTPAQIVVYSAVANLSQPFAGQPMPVIYQTAPSQAPVSPFHLLPQIVAAIWLGGIVVVSLMWAARWIRVLLMVRKAMPLEEGSEFKALRRMESSLGVRTPIKLVLSRNWMEPGIFGFSRPVLIWPEGISQHLDDRHIEAILTHEICHARRRDNLTAVLHMLVEAIFWFHPLVWWMGARLEEERERACDEEVSSLCRQAQVYAESILRVCKFCSESPLACVSGITGADLKRRIVQIMTERTVLKLSLVKKLLLAVTGLLVVAVPIVFGQAQGMHNLSMMYRPPALPVRPSPPPPKVAAQNELSQLNEAQQSPSPTPKPLPPAVAPSPSIDSPVAARQDAPIRLTFEVASIRPTQPGSLEGGIMPLPGGDGYMARNVSVKRMISVIFKVPVGQIRGGPDWLNSDHYDIEAKADHPYDIDDLHEMFRYLLADRFNLKFHTEIKEGPVYALVVDKSGVKMKENGTGQDPKIPITFGKPGEFIGTKVPMQYLCFWLGHQLNNDPRPVINKTGLDKSYDFTLSFVPEGPTFIQQPVSPDEQPDHSSLFDALRKQLGLRLEPQEGPIQDYVIDHIERPSEN
jgi:bla regulator protein BlaR1